MYSAPHVPCARCGDLGGRLPPRGVRKRQSEHPARAPTDRPPPIAAASTTPASVDPCLAVRAEEEAALQAAPSARDSVQGRSLGLDKKVTCLRTTGGTWSLTHRDVTCLDEQGEPAATPAACFNLTSTCVLAFRPDGQSRALEQHDSCFSGGCVGEWRHLDSAFDFDGDGRSEAILTTSSDSECEPPREVTDAQIVLTTKGATEKGFADLEPRFPGKVEDLDGDGLPDESDITLYTADVDTSCDEERDGEHVAGSDPPAITPALVVGVGHMRADRSVTLDDELTRQHLRKTSCDAPVERIFEPKATDRDTGARIACARMWGTSAADVETMLRARCKRFVAANPSGDCNKSVTTHRGASCPAWWHDWAVREPPVHLR